MEVIARSIPCAVSGCKGKIVWEKQNPRSVCGHCDECQAGWTLLLTQGPTWIEKYETKSTVACVFFRSSSSNPNICAKWITPLKPGKPSFCLAGEECQTQGLRWAPRADSDGGTIKKLLGNRCDTYSRAHHGTGRSL